MSRCLVLCVLLFARVVSAQSNTPAYVRGESAFLAVDIAGADRAFREVLETDTVAVHRVEAIRVLASIAWRVRRDSSAASTLLSTGEKIPLAKPMMYLERARMLESFGDHTGARQSANAALRESRSAVDSMAATVMVVESIVEQVMATAVDAHPSLDVSVVELLSATVPRLRAMVYEHPGQTRLARALVNAAAVIGDGPALRDGWRSYYLIGTGDSSRGVLHGARRVFDSVLPTWQGASATAADRAIVVTALVDSRCFDAAIIVATFSGERAVTDPRVKELVHYVRYARGMEEVTDAYYRQVALGNRDTIAWNKEFTKLGTTLWPALRWPGPVPKVDLKRLPAELDTRFAAHLTFGNTAGYSDLHYGHRVLDERRHVTQYGRSADLRFVVLDAMVSNGFQTWAWDGRAGHGGWATKDLIVQVRANYADGALDVWSVLTDPARRAIRDMQIMSDSASDFARARQTPVAYFPSIATRMQRDAQRALLDSLVGAGLSGAALEGTFERVYSDGIQESSIFVHEGRHAIDKLLRTASASADLEYFAKLSELVFSPRPRLSLASIMLGNLGDASPHGQANERVVRGLLVWMETHRSEIRGLNADAPLLPQLPLLSDAQLRTAGRSLDPMARGR